MKSIEQKLIHLYTSLRGAPPRSVTKLPGSGSYRSYYRLQGINDVVIGAHNDDIHENEAFISFTDHFHHEGLPVPTILAIDPEKDVYLLNDLGDKTLYQLLSLKREEEPGIYRDWISPEIMDIYKKVLGWLPLFQINAGEKLDYSVSYPRSAFDRLSMMWDLNYFKYYFLKLAKIPFDEQALENDFSGLCDLLLEAESGFFLYRDFQSRNIMVMNGEPWFIDYQGGRKGALQYDVASLLYDGKANLPESIRQDLLTCYLEKLAGIYPVDRGLFMKYYYGFALIRILQALGAYGFRGYYENKAHFLQSIPYAIQNLRYLRANNMIDFGLDSLMTVIDSMIKNPSFSNKQFIKINYDINFINNELNVLNGHKISTSELTVNVNSFSYKRTIPIDESGNGGGFIFDCRALPNPGRFDEYKALNGTDQPVIDYLEKEPLVAEFLRHTISLVEQSVQTYISRKFKNLMVSFGCTGGQHRSVYCAEKLAEHLKKKYSIIVTINHREQKTTKNTVQK